jgi:hypothetical protein
MKLVDRTWRLIHRCADFLEKTHDVSRRRYHDRLKPVTIQCRYDICQHRSGSAQSAELMDENDANLGHIELSSYAGISATFRKARSCCHPIGILRLSITSALII